MIRKTITSLLGVALLSSAVVIGPAAMEAPGASVEAATTAPGYPYPDAPDCRLDGYGSDDCVADRWSFYQGQCTSWVAFRLNSRNAVAFNNYYKGVRWSDAVYWANTAERLGIAVDTVPGNGAVAWYSYGHVAYVERVNSDGSVVLSEMNYDYHNGYRELTVRRGDAKWPHKFIHIKDLVATTSPAFTPFRYIQDDPRIYEYGRLVYRNGVRVGSERYIDYYTNPYPYAAYRGDFYRTFADPTGTRIDQARWDLKIPEKGWYNVYVYVPGTKSVATVRYYLQVGGVTIDTVEVKQANHTGWVKLGRYSLGTNLVIRSFDNRAWPYMWSIGWDAAMVKRVG